MPDMDRAESDVCSYCGATLRWPPKCCKAAQEEQDRVDEERREAVEKAAEEGYNS